MSSRTPAVLPPLTAHGVHFRLDFLFAQGGPARAVPIGLRQYGVEPLCQQAIQQRLPLLRRKLPRQFADLFDSDRNRKRCHDISSLSSAMTTINARSVRSLRTAASFVGCIR